MRFLLPLLVMVAIFALALAAADNQESPTVRKSTDSELESYIKQQLQSAYDGCDTEYDPEPVRKIEKMGQKALPVLRRLLKNDENEMMRGGSALALAIMQKGKAVPWLIEAFERDANFQVKCTIVYSLKAMRAKSTLPFFLGKIYDPAWRYVAISALGKIGDKAATGPLLKIVGAENEEFGVKRQVIMAFADLLDDRAVPAILKALASGDAVLAETSARTLRKYKNPKLIPCFLAALQHGNAQVRYVALQALRRHKEDKRVFAAIGRASQDPDITVRCAAIAALGECRRTETLPILLSGLNDSLLNVRICSFEALAQYGDPAVASSLQKFCQSDNETDIYYAIRTLVRLGSANLAQECYRSLLRKDKMLLCFKLVDDLIKFNNKAGLRMLQKVLPSVVDRDLRAKITQAISGLKKHVL